MFLENLSIKNFRSFDAIDIALCDALTVFVGENNSGKSNAIDAIRLITQPLSGRRDIYCEPTDIRFDSRGTDFEIEATFENLNPAQQGRFISAATDMSLVSAKFGLRYDPRKDAISTRPTLWAGKSKSTPEPGCHDMIRHVYLPPLRDAKRALASGNPSRIYSLLTHFLEGEEPEAIAKSLSRDDSHTILKRVDTAVEVGLSALTSGVRQQVASLGFSQGEKLIDIARDLRFKLADHGIRPEDLRYSGHGYANLLYMATVAVELEKTNTADLTIFLVEEPEAHLHPQLQAAVLGFLKERAENSRKKKSDNAAPAGHLQVVVATHSPNLSAWVNSKSIVFFRSILPPQEESDASESSTESTTSDASVEQPQPRRATRCIPLGKLGLSDPEQRKIDRYLDVTKSALLFGGRLFLIEGIAEALLLPIIAEKFVLKGQAEKLRLFRSAVFVPIDGVDFEPYARLVLTPFNDVRISDRVVVMTDGDKTTVEEGKELPGILRKKNLSNIAEHNNALGVLEVCVNTYSLETELVVAGNNELMKKVYTKLHPLSADKWDAAVAKAGDEQAKSIQSLFDNTPKGDFAQILAEEIQNGAAFSVPCYFKAAIEAIVK